MYRTTENTILTRVKLDFKTADSFGTNFVQDNAIDFYLEQFQNSLPASKRHISTCSQLIFSHDCTAPRQKLKCHDWSDGWMDEDELRKKCLVIPVRVGRHFSAVVIWRCGDKYVLHWDSIESEPDGKLMKKIQMFLDEAFRNELCIDEISFLRPTVLEQEPSLNNCALHTLCNIESFVELFIDEESMHNSDSFNSFSHETIRKCREQLHTMVTKAVLQTHC